MEDFMELNSAQRVQCEEEIGKSERSPHIPYEVLVVDDNPEVLVVVSLALEVFGYRVTPALNGLKALEILRDKTFDLMVTDLKMDGLDGIGLLKKSKELYPATKVILMTGFYDPEVFSEAIENDADDYVLKPFSLDELQFKAANCLANRNKRSKKHRGISEVH
ncbi:MAG: response regulator [Desulfobacteraceae bacterium]|nr:MAG: response regulator [Desulfobacteraceae bacterium]